LLTSGRESDLKENGEKDKGERLDVEERDRQLARMERENK